MKRATIISILFLCVLYAQAQSISEIQFINRKWYMELVNKQGIQIKTLKITHTASTDTAWVKQSVIDSLNKNLLVVINTDSLLTPIQFNINGDTLKVICNNSITQTFYWWESLNKTNMSWVYLDSAQLHKDNYPLVYNRQNSVKLR